jgi:hypothetical protein
MRIVVFLLLAANLTLLIYTWLDSGGGEGFRLQQQVQPEKIKLLTPREVAALGPSKVAALADVCLEFGPLSDADRAKVVADLEPLALGRLLTQRRVEFDNAFVVGISPFPTRAAADIRAVELRRQGVKDVTVVDAGRGQFAVSFGAFRSEQAALAYAGRTGEAGHQARPVQPRQQTLAQTLLVVRDPADGRRAAQGPADTVRGHRYQVGNCVSTS